VRWHMVRAVARADLTRLFKSRDYWLPLIILAGLFFVIIPFIMLNVVSSADRTPLMAQIGDVIGTLPPAIQDNIQGDSPSTRAAYAFAVYLLAPIAIVVPLTISSAVGANAIVGERERGTGEFLAHSPLSLREIYIGKLLASLVPGYAATLVGFSIYAVIVNVVVGPSVGGWFFPTTGWWLLIFWVVPPFIAIALALILRMSAKVRSAAAAHQASTLITLPVIILSYAAASGLIYSPTWSAFGIGLVAWVVAIILLVRGSRSLRRERLLGVASEA